MNIDEAFPSKYLKASDLQGRSHELEIASVSMEEVGDGNKPVVFFLGKAKGLVLNKINSGMIASQCGSETDTWPSQKITINPDKTMFQGSMVDCIRVRAVVLEPTGSDLDDEIPF